MIQEFFNDKEPCRSINPDEAVAYGAAVQAAILGGTGGDAVKDVLLIDVAPLSMGIETAGEVMTKIIPRNTVIPCVKQETFSTYADNQPAVTIKVFEGERSRTRDNHQLGTFNLEGIPPAPRGVPQIQVSFDLDANGILNVTAEDKKTGSKNQITISGESGRLSQSEIDRMVQDAECFAEQDKAHMEQIQAKNALEGYAYNMKTSMTQAEGKLPEADKQTITDAVEAALEWLDSHQDAAKDVLEAKQKELEQVCNPIVSRMYQGAQSGAGQADDAEMAGHASANVQDVD
jgi:L1 cell adhesion molecule like protein